MVKRAKNIPFPVLSHSQECNLNAEDRKTYYEELRAYCKKRKLTNTTKGALTCATHLKKITGKICSKVCRMLSRSNVCVVTDGLENIPEGAVVFACSHQGVLDGFVWITDCPKHAVIFHGAETNKALLLAQVNTGLILVTKDKTNPNNRINAKLDMISILLREHSVYICPESAWNLSPNKLHLPIYWGFIDVAQKSQKPIVPMVIEYTYDTAFDIETITRIHIRYGKPITVAENDNLMEKLQEYEDSISTMRWELIEEKGLFSRKEILNSDYINFVKGNLRNLEMGKISIDVETKGIRGSNDEFYLFHHINYVPWDAWGEFRSTSLVEKLKIINRVNNV